MAADPFFTSVENLALHPRLLGNERALLEAMLYATDYGMLVSDLNRQDLLANRRLGELFQMTPQEVVMSDPDAVRALARARVHDPEAFDALLEKVYADPHCSLDDEITLTTDPPRFLRRATGPLYDEQGNVIGRLWTFLDITPSKQLQAKIEAKLSETQQQIVEIEKLRTAGTLAASIAHDIRNILSAMQLELALHPSSLRDPLQTHLNRLTTLTHRLLAFAQPGMLDMRPTQIVDVLQRVLSLVLGQALISSVEIVLRVPELLPCIAADARQMEHLFINLCLNAIQAMNDCGGRLTLSAQAGERWLEVRVEDTGPGISLEFVPRLFDAFFTTRKTGAGLGLFSCKRIVEEHGGAIAVLSEPGKGACFTVNLPLMGAEIGQV